MSNNKISQGELIKVVSTRYIMLIFLLLIMFFVPAGTVAYWEAWTLLAVLLISAIPILIYMLKNDPELLERRMRIREKESQQKLIMKIASFYFLLILLLPGFDKRFEWSNVPIATVIIANIFVLLGYGLVFLVFRTNTYASRIIEVEQEQKVISSGPYAVVRHPMYVGISLMYTFMPLALGSYWAIIPSLLIIPILVARIQNEESVLGRELKGYKEYMQKTKYRLVPGVW